MKIVVCIKQVPDTTDIKWTEQNTIQREGVESVINPYDIYALELALKIKSQVENTTIRAASNSFCTGKYRGFLMKEGEPMPNSLPIRYLVGYEADDEGDFLFLQFGYAAQGTGHGDTL